MEKSELEPQTSIRLCRGGRVRLTPVLWQTLQQKLQDLISQPACPVRQFMSLMGLLIATEKQVHLGRLLMRAIQWHLKNSWGVPE